MAAGNSPFRKKVVPASTQSEIEGRLGKSGIDWNAKKFPWISVRSMCSGCDTKYSNLTSITTKGLYEADYKRPLPVITGMDVKKQGELGTTRKATVKLTAFTDTQLVELQKCYFIPGMSVRVEWGWTTAGGPSGGVPFGQAYLGVFSDTTANSLMKYRTKLEPNYEGLQGIVANFSYSLTRDSTWECTVEIIAAAEAFAGSKVDDHSCPECVRTFTGEGEGAKEVTEKRSQLYTFFYDLFHEFNSSSTKYTKSLQTVAAIDKKTINISQYNYMGVQRTESGGDDSSWYEGGVAGWILGGNDPDATEGYISWATLEAAINLFCIPTTNGNFTLGRITSTKMPLSYHPYAISSDPRICIVPGVMFPLLAEFKKGTAAASAVGTVNGKKAIILDNLLINTVFLMMELKSIEKGGDGTIRTFITNVLSKINDACGGIWQFEVVSTASDDDAGSEKYPTISVIDAKIYEAADTTFMLPSMPIGDRASILRDFKLEVKMTDQMKTQALYSNGKQQQVKGDGCKANVFKPFGLAGQGTFKNLASPPATTPPKCDCKDAVSPVPKVPTFGEIVNAAIDEINDTTTSALRSALIEQIAKSTTKGDDAHCDGTPMPFDFSFTLDGIGGFAFGQIVSSDRIPEAIRNGFNWQVTSVEHSVTPNDWSTTVNTVCRYKAK
jgi:hypothetical protein